MRLTRTQVILAGITLLVVVVLVLVFTGVIPGLRPSNPGGLLYSGEIIVWGVYDSERDIQDTLINDFLISFPNVQVNYVAFSPSTYESELIDALAAGRGPDVFMVHNSWLPKHKDKMMPIPAEEMPMSQVRSLFPEVVEKDLTYGGQLYALPLYIDSLVMFYNRPMLDRAGIASAPKTWEELIEIIPKLRQLDKSGRIDTAAVAVGGSNRNIDRGSDLLAQIMLQYGVDMTNGNYAGFDDAKGEAAVGFYTNFAKPSSPAYTWDLSFLNSIDAFTQERAAIVFNYAYQIPTIEAKNPFLDFGIASMVQFKEAIPVNYANYWALAVSNTSQNANTAWGFVFSSTLNEEVSNHYLATVRRPGALRQLIGQTSTRTDALGVFSRQALTAKSWRQIDTAKVDTAFGQMVESILQGQLTIKAALRQAGEKVTALLSRYPIQ
ncbi:MAG: hypothetical protein COU10_03025 [Candidatus Harrisonbacteria bacterium CG10_big_fil_rev_8_21_14_0_10_45_28]|uniref:ABC transporter substrate-binding protein n=1 Tax=Candidatus Harrisonbacteria bacterium CG10_big_fil_rev_8_21_14_0_10_45_28 TaxID=1974586 RepID=A0A2H0UMX7_9BACT|nr:MAG: hypothetical protein COU10_03025 [Candidatus Harrisonbacteria bacterium CG10_big_fil_rev_8_21_14_0_10_45_28]